MELHDQSFVALAFRREKLSLLHFYKDLTRKTNYLEGLSWFKFNNLGLVLGIALTYYCGVAKELIRKVKRFSGLISP